MEKYKKNDWMNEFWLNMIIRTVTARGRRHVMLTCSVDWDDIRQDTLFGRKLGRLRHEGNARNLAYRFFNRAWQKRRRIYLKTCPRLLQFSVLEND
jgi:hypothetical protein